MRRHWRGSCSAVLATRSHAQSQHAPQELAHHSTGVHRRRVCGAQAASVDRVQYVTSLNAASAGTQGGCDIVKDMHFSGELAKALAKVQK